MTVASQKTDENPSRSLDLTDLRAQLEQQCDSSKLLATLWVSWFTFFLTVNYVAIGWFTTTTEGNTIDKQALFIVAGNFIVQLALGIAATMILHRWTIDADKNMKRVSAKIRELTPRESHAFSFEKGRLAGFITPALLIGACAMGVLVIAWCFIAVHAQTHTATVAPASRQTGKAVPK